MRMCIQVPPNRTNVQLELLAAAAVALVLAVVFAPPRVGRASLLPWGLAGLAGMAAIALAPSLDLVLLIVLVLAVLQARLASHRDFATRVRGPVLAVALLAIGLAFERVDGPVLLERFGAVGIVGGRGGGGRALSGMPTYDTPRTGVGPPAALARLHLAHSRATMDGARR